MFVIYRASAFLAQRSHISDMVISCSYQEALEKRPICYATKKRDNTPARSILQPPSWLVSRQSLCFPPISNRGGLLMQILETAQFMQAMTS